MAQNHAKCFKIYGEKWYESIGGLFKERESDEGSIRNKLLHFLRFKTGKFSKLSDGNELVGFFSQALADVVQDPVAGFLAFAGDALNVFGIYANAFGLHFP